MFTSLFFHTAFVPVPVTEETVMYHCFNEIKDPSEDLYNKRRRVKIDGKIEILPLYEDPYKYPVMVRRERRAWQKIWDEISKEFNEETTL